MRRLAEPAGEGSKAAKEQVENGEGSVVMNLEKTCGLPGAEQVKMSSTLSSVRRVCRSARKNITRSPNHGLRYSLAARSMFSAWSTAITRPSGNGLSNSAVRRPVPHPASSTSSSPGSFRYFNTFRPQESCGSERRW